MGYPPARRIVDSTTGGSTSSRRARGERRSSGVARLIANPLVVLLLVAGTASALLREVADAAIIFVIVLASSGRNAWQTMRSARAVRRLQRQIAPTATVLRDGTWVELPRRRIVAGDILRLSAGDMVPADARLLEATDLHVQQAALTGESLPAEKLPGDGALAKITTVTLAQGAIRMSREKVIVKHLSSIQNLGSIDILCSDKTGTLTAGTMSLDASLDPFGQPSPRALALAQLNSRFETGIKSPLDAAILERAAVEPEGYAKTDEIPFDFERRRRSVVVENAGRRLLVTKGAPESLFDVSSS